MDRDITLKDTLKSADTEEWFDMIFYRKIGFAVAKTAMRYKITPNTITIIGIIIGSLGGVMLYYNTMLINIVGMVLLVFANSLDSADGQLARITKQYSRLGRILDGMCGDIWFIIIYFAVVWRMRDFQDWSIWAYVFASVAGYCHIRQAAIADCYRTLHLFFLKGRANSELDEVETIRQEIAKTSFLKSPIKKIMLMFYIGHTSSQQQFSPQMRKMRKTINALYPNEIPEDISQYYVTHSRPLLKYTNMLTFNTRIAVLFISILVDIPWIYFVFELTVLNVMLIYMIVKYEKISRKTIKLITTKQ